MNQKFFTGLVTGAFVIGMCNIAVAALYEYDFESGTPSEITGGNSVETSGYSTLGFGSYFLHSSGIGEVITLSLTGLAAHNSIDLDFDLAVIDSWDGDDPEYGPDYFNITMDGSIIDNSTLVQDWNGSDSIFSNSDYEDSARHFSFSGLAHNADSISISWFAGGDGYQGLDDESFALDNIQLNVHAPVPEPATFILFATGLVGLIGLSRRKKK